MTMLARLLHGVKSIFSTKFITIAFLFMSLYCQYKFITEQKLSDQIKKNGADVEIKPDRNITVFYNVYTNPSADPFVSKQIVQEQMLQMKPYHKVFVRSIGKNITSLSPFTIRHDEEGNEIETLEILFQHCKQNPGDTVVYLHNKGSFHPSPENDKLRRFLTRGALSRECVNMPSTCNVCSSRMSPLPHPHTSGNMWAAKCEYVRKLISPTELGDKMNQIFKKELDEYNGYAPCLGAGRYAAEHWIHSHPSVLPCDLSTDDRFTWNYENIPEVDFKITLGSAPRFEFKKYRKPHICPPYLLDVRLKEYKAIYNELPDDSWWGWKFYDIPREDGEWCHRGINVPFDPVCGGLWTAKFPPINLDGANSKKKIHVVISYCKTDLQWFSNFTKGCDIASVHIISKCKEPVKSLPENATVEELPNVGRCDHSYAHYIIDILGKCVKRGEEKDSVVFFLKDDISPENMHQGGDWKNFESMFNDVSSSNGFACGIQTQANFSPYHHSQFLFEFQLHEYHHKAGIYEADNANPFQSNFKNLGDFYKTVIASGFKHSVLPELVQVCYGGVFAASYENIMRTDASTWRRIRESLSRGNSIEEGHFVERLWGSLLATHLRPYQIEALNTFAPNHTQFPVGTGRYLPGMMFRSSVDAERNSKPHKVHLFLWCSFFFLAFFYFDGMLDLLKKARFSLV